MFQKIRNAKNVSLLLIGLDGAGKTTALNAMTGQCPDLVSPTVGQNIEVLRKDKYRYELIELGGAKSIRDIWSKYYERAHGAVFMVDGTDRARFKQSVDEFRKIREKLQGKPIIVVVNTKGEQRGTLPLDMAERNFTSSEQQVAVKVVDVTKKRKVREVVLGTMASFLKHSYRRINARVKAAEEKLREEEEARVEKAMERRREREEREAAVEAEISTAQEEAHKRVDEIFAKLRDEISSHHANPSCAKSLVEAALSELFKQGGGDS